MRATVIIDEGLYRELEARAGASGRTVDALIEDTLRDSLGIPNAPPDPELSPRSTRLPPLPVSKELGWVRPGVDIYDNAAVRDLLDDAPVLTGHGWVNQGIADDVTDYQDAPVIER